MGSVPVCHDQPCSDDASTCADYVVTFCYVDGRFGGQRELCTENVEDYYGCRLPAVVGFRAWRAAIPGILNWPQWIEELPTNFVLKAIHHLFPRIPRHNLRTAQKLVMEFCKKSGVPYALYGFYDGNKKVVGHLGEVGRQAKILAECQAAIINKGDPGHM